MLKIKLLVLLSLFSFAKKTVAQDWANLSKYKPQNKKLLAMAEDKNRVVFMGNSITEGWTTSFFENPSYINRGISGQTTPQMLLRFRQDVIDLKPKIVLILAGTNDIAGNTGPMTLAEIRGNILSMVELAETNGICPIICSVLPAYDYPWKPGLNPNIKIPKLNTMLKDIAAKKGVFYLDYFTAMADERNGLPSKLTTDEVHLTKEGYDILSDLAEKAIKEVMIK
jgi:lysophospholipase L1-like esterase